MIIVINDQQFFDPPLVQRAPRLFLTDASWNRCQIVLGHQLGNLLFRIFRKANVAIRQYADQFP